MRIEDVPVEHYYDFVQETITRFSQTDDIYGSGMSHIDRAVRGIEYYNGRQKIDDKKVWGINDDGVLEEARGIPNSKLKDNQYRKVVDQKVDYLLSNKPNISIETSEMGEEEASRAESYVKCLLSYFDTRFIRTLRKTALDAYNTGCGWLYVYLSEDGDELEYQAINPLDIIPIWEDDQKETLNAVIWKRTEPGWDKESGSLIDHKYIRLCTKKAMFEWEVEPTGEKSENFEMKVIHYLSRRNKTTGEETGNATWGKLPFIYFRYDKEGYTLLDRVISLQDALNDILSNFSDKLMTDIRSSVLVVRGYGGEDLAEVKNNLIYKGIVGVASDGDKSGGIDTLDVDYTPQEYDLMLQLLKEKLVENGRGIDQSHQRVGQYSNELNIKSYYSDIELDANALELEYRASFAYLENFIQYVYGFDDMEINADFTFRRNINIAENSKIQNIIQSQGIISRETALENHPYVNDPKEEMERIKRENLENYDQLLQGYDLEADDKVTENTPNPTLNQEEEKELSNLDVEEGN